MISLLFSVRKKHSHRFIYIADEDEDGDTITAKCDADLDGFRTAVETRSVTAISLGLPLNLTIYNRNLVKPIDNASEIEVVLPSDLQHLDIISSGQFGTVFK